MEYACEQQKYARAQGLSFDVMARYTHMYALGTVGALVVGKVSRGLGPGP